MRIALGLAHCGFGDSLLEAVLSQRLDLPLFLVQWREDLSRELRTDSKGRLGKKYAGLADTVPIGFPNIDIVDAYVFPTTSWSDGDGPDLGPLSPKFPDVTNLAAFCVREFSWGGTSGTLSKLCNVLWEGMCVAMLREVRSIIIWLCCC
jgi:holliday junction resolvase YEN1